MQTRHTAGFPEHPLRVPGGAGDEEALETGASPPAVAGPLVLDAATGSDNFGACLARLASTAAAVMAGNIHTPVDCALVVVQPGCLPATSGTSLAAVRLLGWELVAHQGPANAVLAGGHPVSAYYGDGDLRWPQYAAQMYDAGLGSSLAVRLRLDCCREWHGTRAALTFHAPRPGGAVLEVIAAARFLAGPAAQGLQGVLDRAGDSSDDSLRTQNPRLPATAGNRG